MKGENYAVFKMSEEQLSAFLATLKADEGLQAKLKGATDLDSAVEIANEAGFDVTKADWLNYQAQQTLELNDKELEDVAGGWGQCNNSNQTKGSCGQWYCATP